MGGFNFNGGGTFGGELVFPAYPNTRNDGTPVNILGTDVNGHVVSGPNQVVHIGGNFVDTTDQSMVASTSQSITFNVNSTIDDLEHTVGTDLFTIKTAGMYHFELAPQLAQGANAALVEFWMEKNSVDVVNSGIQITIGANSEALPILRWKERFIVDDIFKLIVASNSSNTSLDNITSLFGGPNIPSVMLGVTQIGD